MRSWRWYAREVLTITAITACVWLVAKLTGFL
jgi:hypothetical protein